MDLPLDQRPVIIALAGSNGAGKTTFYYSHLQSAGLRFVNADVLARELDLDPYAAARLASALRGQLVEQRESFVFETVFSDPAGEKLKFLKDAAGAGYNVILCFVAISGPDVSEERVAMRVSQGGPMAGANACTNGCRSVLEMSFFSYQVAAGSTMSE